MSNVDSILNFWFGDSAWGTRDFNSVSNFSDVSHKWFGMKDGKKLSKKEQDEIDNECKQFLPLFDHLEDPEWSDNVLSVKGLYAKMILTDQLSRNCFRGSKRAFEYDEIALNSAKKMYVEKLVTGMGSPERSYFGYVHFMFFLIPFQHSENLVDHAMMEDILAQLGLIVAADGSTEAVSFYQNIKFYCDQHTKVFKLFGRYPHRNKAKGRHSTPSEIKWLSDTDNLPEWAKSQM